jgi:squalene-associated FAD-dependent desaturase
VTARVVVVGGGLAGLTAACELADRGLDVTLLEARARLGGVTFSFHRGDLVVDNGQHVLLRCYTAYLDFLRRLGVAHHIDMQPRMRIPVQGPDGRLGSLSRTALPAPLHLLGSLATYRLLSAPDRLRAALAVPAMRRLDPDDPALDEQSLGDWLRRHGQNDNTIAALWNLITVAALNCDADEASLALAAKVFRTGLLDRSENCDIGVPAVPLSQLHGDPAESYLRARGARVRLRTAVKEIRRGGNGFEVVTADDTVPADAVVVATPADAAARLAPEHVRHDLGHSPIVNVHVIYSRRVTDLPFVAVVGSPVQWAFDRTAVSGLAEGQYLAVSVSAAGDWIDQPAQRLRELFLPELGRVLPGAAGQVPTDFFVTKERTATFRQQPGSGRRRPAQRTGTPGLVLAGAWTATGWPDTMEGAVRSGQNAARLVSQQLATAVSEVAR